MFVVFFLDIDECLEVSCLHNAQCMNTAGSFQCMCTTGWTGTFCEIGKIKMSSF